MLLLCVSLSVLCITNRKKGQTKSWFNYNSGIPWRSENGEAKKGRMWEGGVLCFMFYILNVLCIEKKPLFQLWHPQCVFVFCYLWSSKKSKEKKVNRMPYRVMCIEEAVFLAPLSPTFPLHQQTPPPIFLIFLFFSTSKAIRKFPQNRLSTSPIHHPIKNIQNWSFKKKNMRKSGKT